MIRHYRVNRMRQPAQCKCGWCGKWMTSPDDCLSVEQKDALAHYARKHGGYWKSHLATQWKNGNASEMLTQAMDIIGLAGLYKVKSMLVKDYYPPKQKPEKTP